MWPLQASEAANGGGRAVAGLSGGVDSTVSALLALRDGWDVTGLTLLVPGAATDAAERVCEDLGIQHRTVDARDEFERCVLREFVADWARGLTPNPCIECNPRVKFRLLAREADTLGCEGIVSGHYARTRSEDGHWHLLRGGDRSRDQSYMLHRLPEELLSRLVLPLGGRRKDEVRRIAADAGLTAAERPDSQDICFAPDGDFTDVIARRRPEALAPGPILTEGGRELGQHRGLARYTVGQRRGLGLGGPEGPWFVLRIDPERNALIVGDETDLWVGQARIERLHLIGPASAAEFEATVMTRYRGTETPATVAWEGTDATVRFHSPHRAPAPGQSAVFYAGERCLGGGVIVQEEPR